MRRVARISLRPGDRTFFDLFIEAGHNTVLAARLLHRMMQEWPDAAGLTQEIIEAEHEGDRITHDIIQRLNSTFDTPIDREDVYGLATQMDDIVDFTEEAADFLGLYKIEAPMEQAVALTGVLVKACEQLAEGLEHLPEFKDLDEYWIEIHRLENEGDRISRDAVASLFSNGIDPMVVIRWKDMFSVLEEAIDATEDAAQILEGIVIKTSRRRSAGRRWGRRSSPR
jgi:predicted phosphate transport protein (TIGR00153 family)